VIIGTVFSLHIIRLSEVEVEVEVEKSETTNKLSF